MKETARKATAQSAGICMAWIKQSGICMAWIDQNGQKKTAQRPTISLKLGNLE